MAVSISELINHRRFKQVSDPRNIALYIFCIIVLAIAWSGVRTMQNNYELQRKISALKQQNNVLQLQNENAGLQNKYYQTDEYLDLAARQDLGLASPGEKVLLIPKSVALKYVDQSVDSKPPAASPEQQSEIIKNFEAWRDFLLGRKSFSD
jgi:cell division protein FtsB